MNVPITKIKPSPLNESVYGNITDGSVAGLLESIRELGVLTPLILNNDYECISGHRRFYCCKKLAKEDKRFEKVPVVIKDISAEDTILFLIEANRQRDKTSRQKLNEAKHLYEYYGNRRGARTDLTSDYLITSGKVRDRVAEDLGTSHNTISRLLYIDEHYSEIIEQIPHNISLNQAYLQVKKIQDRSSLKESNTESKQTIEVDLTDGTDGENYVIYNKSCESMDELDDESVQLIITSPPYYLIRDYGLDNEIGKEDSLEEYLDRMMVVMKECHRVLRNDGTFFMVMGDKWNNGSLMMHQHRLAIRMTDELGFKLRNNLIYQKSNPKPESVKNRFMHGHEDIFFFSKQNDYQIDLDAIRIPYKEPHLKVSRAPKHHLKNDTGMIHYQTANIKDDRGKIPNTYDWQTTIINQQRNEPPPYGAELKHNAAFPYDLINRFTLACLKQGQVGLDCFLGSGTSLLSFIDAGGYGVGYELQSKYVALAHNRLKKSQKKMA